MVDGGGSLRSFDGGNFMPAIHIYGGSMKALWTAVAMFLTAGLVPAQESGNPNDPVPFSFEQAFYAYFNKTNKTPDADDTEVFISEVHEDEYRQYWRSNDEFGKRKFLQQVEPQIKNGISQFDSKALYLAAREIRLDEYNFDKEGFPISYYSGAANIGPDRFDVLVVFSNSDDFQFMKMSPDDAETFLKSRRNWTGSANRDVIMVFYFKVADLNKAFDDLCKKRQYNRGFLLMHGIIEKVEVYDKYNDVVVGELTKK
jgi:hypothetical protein